MSWSDRLEAAQDILNREPLPDNAEQQIDELYARANDREKALFPDVYEALFIALPEDRKISK